MKKILAVLLALTLVFSLAACGCSNTEDATEASSEATDDMPVTDATGVIYDENSVEAEVVKATNEYLAASTEMDLEALTKLVVDPTNYNELLSAGVTDLSGMLKLMYQDEGIDQMFPGKAFDAYVGLMEKISVKANEKTEITIIDVAAEESTATVEVLTTTVDSSLMSADMDAALTAALENIEYSEEEGLTEDQWVSVFGSIEETLLPVIDTLDMIEVPSTLTLVNENGSWLVDEQSMM